MRWALVLCFAVSLACGAAVPPTQDGGPASVCAIGDASYPAGATPTGNPCQICEPAVSTTSFTAAADLTACDAGAGVYCRAGLCIEACGIGGQVYAAGAANPMNACQTCAPNASLDQWTAVPGCPPDGGQPSDGGPDGGQTADGGLDGGDGGADGGNAGCGADGTPCFDGGTYCLGGACLPMCDLSGSLVDAGTLDPSGCQSCQPASSAIAFTPLADGTSCVTNGGNLCLGGLCVLACDIAGAVVDAGVLDSSGCGSCQPTSSPVGYTSLADGTVCSAGGGNICSDGGCVAGCFISNAVVPAHTFESPTTDVCCNPALAATTWTAGFLALPGFSPTSAVTALATDTADNAGRSELVYGTASGEVEVLFGQADGGFLASQIVASGPSVSAVALADMNGDGFADVAYLAGAAPVLYTQQSNGGFNGAGAWPTIPDASGLWAVDVGAQTQMLSFNRDFMGSQPPATFIPQTDNNGTLVAGGAIDLDYLYTTDTGYGPPVSLATGSLLSPGSTDLAVYCDLGGGTFFFDFDGGWQQLPGMDHNAFAVGGPLMALGDVNGDGLSDVASGGGGSLSLYMNQPFDSTQARLASVGSAQVPSGANFTGLAFAALRGDGGDQIVASDSANSAVEVYTALPRYDAGVILLGTYPTASPTQLVVGDFNGDGRPDVAIAVASGARIQVFQRQCP